MKGTLKREGDDKKEIDFLKNDSKNKSENTMIVDLIRNDLAKIKDSFNIKTEKLFEIETHKTLHQMTSTISAKLKKVDLKDIFSCLFPCGSITGAPKISTMDIIDKIENYKRQIYCGAIGQIHKDNALFSAPIRILERKEKENVFKFCQGGAIVWKSNTKDEWDECKTKRLFLGNSIDFDLIETILIKNNTPQLYFEHLKRLKNSCKKLGFKFNNNLINEKFENNKIARIILNKNGDYEISYRKIDTIETNKIDISNLKTYSKNEFLYHKTDFRPWYKKTEKSFDTLYTNEKEELTEGTRTNIILLLDSKLYTPKTSCGLLGGTARNSLILNKQIKEKVLYKEDLFKAEKIFLINSIRGILEVKL